MSPFNLIAAVKLLNMFRSSRSKVRRFRQSRARLSDTDFVTACELPDDPVATQAALAVRRAVANIGLVDSQFIRPEDDYPGSLEALPLWDSMDWVAFVLELEEELGIEIPDSEAIEITTTQRVTTKQMVSAFYQYLKTKERTQPGT